MLVLAGGALMLVSGLGLRHYRMWAAQLITALFLISGSTSLGIVLWVRTGLFDQFSDNYPILFDLIVLSGIWFIISGIVFWYLTRPLTKQIIRFRN